MTDAPVMSNLGSFALGTYIGVFLLPIYYCNQDACTVCNEWSVRQPMCCGSLVDCDILFKCLSTVLTLVV
jgi:hypothetical protein